MTKRNLRTGLGLALTAFALTTSGQAWAAAKSWDSGGTTNVWNNAANWDADTLPANGDSLTFGSGTKLTITNNVLTTIGTLTFTNGNYAIYGTALTNTGAIGSTTSNNTWAINTTFNTTQTVTVEAATNTLTFSGVVAGAGGINKAGSGTLLLSGANTFAGNVAVDGGGELRLANNLALGNSTAVNLSASAVGAGATRGNKLGLNGVSTPATATITLNAAVTGDLRSTIYTTTGSNNVNGPLILKGDGTCQVVCNNAAHTLVLNGNVTGSGLTGLMFVRGVGPLIINSPTINLGAGRFDKTDANVVTLTTSGHTWAATEILTGTVKLGTHNALPIDRFFTLGQAGVQSPVFDLGGFSQAVPNLVVIGTMTNPQNALIGNSSLTSDSTLTYSTISNSIFNGTLLDSVAGGTRKLALTVAGGGSLTLTSTNTYSGPTTLNDAGTKLVVPTLQTGGGAFTANDGTILGVALATAGTSLRTAALALGNGTSATAEFYLGSGNPTAPVLYATNLAANGTVTVNVTGQGLALGQFPLIKYGSVSGVSDSTFVLNTLPAGVLAYLSNNVAGTSIDLVVTQAPLIVWTGATNDDLGLVLLSPWDINTTSNWLDSLTLSPTFYTDGQVVQFDDSAIGTNVVTLAANVAPGSVTVTNAAKDYAITGTSAILGAGRFTKDGAGTVTVATTNAYTGDTLINAGTFRLGTNNVIPDGAGKGNVVLGGTLDLAGFSEAVNGLSGSGTINNSAATAATLTLGNNNQSGSFAGTILNTGALSLVKAGTGGLTLSGNNAFSGNLTVSGGSLALNGPATPTGTLSLGGTLRTLGSITNTGPVALTAATTLSVDPATTLQLGGLMTGAQNLTKIGGGNLVLTNVSVISSFWPQNGTVVLQNNAVMTNNAFVSVGRIANDDATLYLKNNALMAVTNADFNLGDTVNAIGRLYIQDSAKLALKNLWLGKNTTCQGYVYQSGGAVTNAVTASSDWQIGGFNTAAAGSFGGYYLSNGKLDVRGNLQVGAYGTGEMIVSGGTVNIWAGYPVVGRYTNSVGRLVLSGGQFNQLGAGNYMIVGEAGTGTLVISNTGALFCTNALYIGSFNVNAGTGTVTLATGGSITTPKVGKLNVAGSGTLNLDGGLLRANTNTLTYLQGLDAARILDGGVTFDSAGYTVTVAQPLLAVGTGGVTKVGLGSVSLEGASTYTGPTVVSNGKLALSTLSTGGGTIGVADGTILGVTVGGAGGSLKSASVTLGAATGAGLDFNFSYFGNPSVAPLRATNLALNGTITVNVVAGNLSPGSVKLITFDNPIAGAGGFVLGTLPQGVIADPLLVTNGNTIELNVTAVQPLTWRGTTSTNWDINTTANWDLNGVGAKYLQPVIPGDVVRFDDTLVTGLTNVNLATVVSPAAIVVSNNLLGYVIGGANKISGLTGINKSGTNSLRISTANDFTGPVNASAGLLIAGNAAAFGATNAGVNIGTGATLDVNGLNLGFEPVVVAGAGLGSGGAVINSGASQINALNNLTLAGDTTLGGTSRWDLRISGTTQASLSTTGNPYKLTKVGVNQVGLVSTTVDPALGDIDVVGGIFSFEVNSTSLGNPAYKLTVFTNAVLQLWAPTNLIDKPIVLNGGTNAQIINGSGTSTVIGPITLNASSTINVGGTSLILNGPIGETAPYLLTRATGTALLVLGGNNTYSGGTALTAGITLANSSAAFGSGPVNLTGAVNCRIQLGAGVSIPNVLNLGVNPGAVGRGALEATGTNYATWAGPINVSAGPTSGGVFFTDAAALLTLAGPVTSIGGTGLSQRDGRVVYAGGGSYAAFNLTGLATIGADNGMATNVALSIGASGAAVLDLNGFNQTLAALLKGGSAATVTNSSATLSLLTVGRDLDNTYSGLITGNLGLVKDNTNVLTLGGANTYSGPTTVKQGGLLIQGVNSGAGAVTVVAGGTLGGNGAILGPVMIAAGGTLSVGVSAIGRLGITNSLTFLAGSTNLVEVNTTSATSDSVGGLSSVTLGGTLVITNLGAAPFTTSSTFKLFDAAAIAGAFDAIVPAAPSAALAWDTSTLTVDGVLRVKLAAAPTIAMVGLLPDGNFRLTLNGSIGQPYSVLVSGDVALPLAAWTVLQTGTITTVPQTVDDLTATNYPQRFYNTSTP